MSDKPCEKIENGDGVELNVTTPSQNGGVGEAPALFKTDEMLAERAERRESLLLILRESIERASLKGESTLKEATPHPVCEKTRTEGGQEPPDCAQESCVCEEKLPENEGEEIFVDAPFDCDAALESEQGVKTECAKITSESENTEEAVTEEATEATEKTESTAESEIAEKAESTEREENAETPENDEKADGRISVSMPAATLATHKSERQLWCERECDAAYKRHQALKAEAIAAAGGVYAEEVRLLHLERARYNAELAAIRSGVIFPVVEEREGEKTFPTKKQKPGSGTTEGGGEIKINYPTPTAPRKYNVAPTYPDPITPYGADITLAGEDTPNYSPRSRVYPHVATTEGYSPHCQGAYPYTDIYGMPVPVSQNGVYPTDSDEELMRQYDAYQAKRERGAVKQDDSGAAIADGYDDYDGDLALADEATLSDYDSQMELVALQDKSELTRTLTEAYKKEKELRREIAALEAKEKRAERSELAHIVVEKIALQKEICELSMDSLHASVYAKSRMHTARVKHQLAHHIAKYNSFIDEYEALTGISCVRLQRKIVKDIAQGKLPEPIQSVYYVYEEYAESDTPVDALPSQYEENEQLRFAREYDAADERIREQNATSAAQSRSEEKNAKRESARQFAERMAAVKTTCEKDVVLVNERFNYNIGRLEAERDMKLYSHGGRAADRSRAVRRFDALINRLKSNLYRALRYEKEDNERYYYLANRSLDNEKVRKKARRDRLEAYKTRLEALLAEREEINNRLLALYGNPEGKKKNTRTNPISRINAVKKKYAKSIHRSQIRMARRLERLHAPLDLKDKIFELMNKKIESVALIEGSRYKLRYLRPRGRARKEILREMRSARSSVRMIDKDIRFLMRRAERHHALYADDRSWVGWLIGAGIIILIGVLIWYFAGDEIWRAIEPYFNK